MSEPLRHFDVIVAGVGAMGSAACWRMALRGARVLGIDRFGIPNASGSAHGESRAIRLCYHEHASYVPLLQRAYRLWDELQSTSGRTILRITGGLYMGHPEREVVAGTLRAAEMHGLPHELLDHAGLRDRFPQFVLPEDRVGVYEPEAGLLHPTAAVSAAAALAMAHGAELHGHETVHAWEAAPRRVTVRTDRATYTADRLIICAGAWSGDLLGDLAGSLEVTRQVIGWVRPRSVAPFALGTLPVWAIEDPRGFIHYGFPMLPETLGLKVAHHCPGPSVHADAVDRTPRPEDEDTFRPVLARFMPEADGPLLALRVCLYTNTPDAHFIVDRHPRHENVVIMGGFSGHGFKFASVMGEAGADLALRGRTDLPIGFLRLGRF